MVFFSPLSPPISFEYPKTEILDAGPVIVYPQMPINTYFSKLTGPWTTIGPRCRAWDITTVKGGTWIIMCRAFQPPPNTLRYLNLRYIRPTCCINYSYSISTGIEINRETGRRRVRCRARVIIIVKGGTWHVRCNTFNPFLIPCDNQKTDVFD